MMETQFKKWADHGLDCGGCQLSSLVDGRFEESLRISKKVGARQWRSSHLGSRWPWLAT